jgi:crotonobetaine/carnitine-CoA ligase
LAWFGSIFAGMIDVAINHGLVKDMLVHQLKVAGVRAIVCDEASYYSLAQVLEDAPGLEFVIAVDSVTAHAGVRLHPFSLLAAETALEPQLLSPTAIQSIRYTSGTTGPAKAVALINSQMVVFAVHPITLMEYKPEDRLYTCFPLHHSLASIMGVVASFQAGGCCIVDDRFSASQFWDRIRRNRATLSHILNPVVSMLLAQPPRQDDRGHGCRNLWTAFSNAQFEHRFGARLMTHYSMTEANVIAYPPPGGEDRPGSCGVVGPLFEVQVVDDQENPVEAGQTGEILWRPRHPYTMMARYYGDAEATVAAWRNLWFHSGDEGWLDRDGYLFLIGRMGDQIRRKGVNIPALHVEEAALKYSGVVEAAAIAVPSDLGESEVKLSVMLPAALRPSHEEFAAFLAEQLPREMVPRYLEFRDDLPRTDTHKVSKAKMRQEGKRGITDSTVDLSGYIGRRQ